MSSCTHQIAVGLLTHDAAERHDWTDDSKEDEEDGGNALDLESVGDVTQVVRVAVLYVVDKSAKRSKQHTNSRLP